MTKLSEVVRGVGIITPHKLYATGRQVGKGHFVYANGYNSLAKAEVVVLEDKIQDVLAQTFGCKPTKEDCSFESCKSWGRCECLRFNFATAIESGSIIRLKEEEK